MTVLTAEQASKYLNFKSYKAFLNSLPQLRKQGLPGKKLGTGRSARWRFVQEKIDEWLTRDVRVDVRTGRVVNG